MGSNVTEIKLRNFAISLYCNIYTQRFCSPIQITKIYILLEKQCHERKYNLHITLTRGSFGSIV